MSGQPEAGALLDHLFRRQAGRMVAHFTRLLGPANLDLAEEAVQEAMVRALESWPYHGAPENPAAWLFRVAHNSAIDAIRRRRRMDSRSEALVAGVADSAAVHPGSPGLEEHLADDELRMIFMCCHPGIPRDSAVALSLKTAGGFSVREIARAFFSEDATIAQRLVRAKRLIRESRLTLDLPEGKELPGRLDAVLETIYIIFNEGYAAHEGDDLIRHDLCREALRLGQLVASSPLEQPRVHALVALMALQAARSNARVDSAGDLVLLDDQDRNLWDWELIALGFRHFDRSIAGDEVSPYHVQAAIAATHARAAAGNPVDWPAILTLYDQMLAIQPSPVVALNRTVAVSKVRGAAAGLAALDELQNEPKFRDYYLYFAVRGHLCWELGRRQEAAECFGTALGYRCSVPERRFLERRLAGCNESGATGA